MEVAAGDDVAIGEDQRVVGGSVQLDRGGPGREGNGVGDGAEHLRRAAQAVGVLDPVVVLAVRLADGAVGEQRAHERGRGALSRVRTGVVNAGVERRGRSAQRLEAHRRGADGRAPEHARIVHQEGQDRGLGLGPIDEGNAFLGPEPVGRESRGGERRRGGDGFAGGAEQLAFAHEYHRHVTERGEVAAGADASLLRHPRHEPGVDQRDHGADEPGPDAAGRPEQHVRPQDHQRAHDVRRERRPETGGMAADQVHLEAVELVGRDAHAGQLAEPGVDPVDRLPAGHGTLDEGPAPFERRPGVRGDPHPRRRIARRPHHALDRERRTVEHQADWHAAKISESGAALRAAPDPS